MRLENPGEGKGFASPNANLRDTSWMRLSQPLDLGTQKPLEQQVTKFEQAEKISEPGRQETRETLEKKL